MKASVGLITIVLLALPVTTEAQTTSVMDMLSKINQAVLKLEHSQFTFHDKVTKLVSDGDPSHTEHTTLCFLKKNPEDALMGYQFASFREDGYQQIYDGSQLFTVYDQTLQVTSKQNYSSNIKEQFEGFTGPTYLTNTNKFLQYFNQPSSAQHIRLLGLDYFLGEKCYRLANYNSPDSTRTSEVYYYVSAHSFLPLRTVTILTSVVGKTREKLIFDYSITDLKEAISKGNQFSREILSDYQLEKNYNPYKENAKHELLPVGSTAPNWKLPLITGNTLELSDLKGKVIIMDFWFKACAPCQKQMLALQGLHEKFNSDDVVIIGINTIDDPQKDRLDLFLKNRLITMPSVYKGNSIESFYKVYGSPALFIIDRQGVIIYTASGYSSTLIEEVSKVIVKQLK